MSVCVRFTLCCALVPFLSCSKLNNILFSWMRLHSPTPFIFRFCVISILFMPRELTHAEHSPNNGTTEKQKTKNERIPADSSTRFSGSYSHMPAAASLTVACSSSSSLRNIYHFRVLLLLAIYVKLKQIFFSNHFYYSHIRFDRTRSSLALAVCNGVVECGACMQLQSL